MRAGWRIGDAVPDRAPRAVGGRAQYGAAMAPVLLVVTQVAPYADGPAGAHGVLDQAGRALAGVADCVGLEAVEVRDVRHLDPDLLARTAVLALFTIGETPWNAAQRTTIVERLRTGTLGVLAIHSATDSCHTWPDYGSLVGARFDGHPWTTTVPLDVVAPDHPACAHLGALWEWRDEIYLFRDLRPDARVLLRVPDDALDMSVPGARRPECGFPLAWCFTEGEGRVFSTSLGHFPAAWESTVFLRHVTEGLRWVRAA